MTVPQTLAALARQWMILLVGAACSVGVAFAASRTQTVYWAQTTVRFVPAKVPAAGIEANKLVTTSEALIAFAGLVLADLDVEPGPEVSTMAPTILDVGIYDGVRVRLPDSGGQWSHSFGDAYLDVQVSGPTPDRVRDRTQQTVDAIRDAVASRLGSASASVEVRPMPPTPTVLRETTGRAKPAAASLVLGLAATVGLALLVDRRRRQVASVADVPVATGRALSKVRG